MTKLKVMILLFDQRNYAELFKTLMLDKFKWMSYKESYQNKMK